ncbi:MAG: class I SAM-dependent methyltransferase [Oscillospiraceae bacterium]|nr:class I SAM-dependent methyltransferase [Oscillospiraceae bacterium]
MVTGWEFERRVHFDEIVVNYDKARPEYPSELFADVFNYVKGKKALEIGAGTGKATKPFLDAGYDVTAVELGANMSEFLRAKFENLNVINAAFEEVELEYDTYDLIYAGSAFHWVDQSVGIPKVLRTLKSGGVFALFRYNNLSPVNDELDDEIFKVFEKHYFTFYTSKPKIRLPKRTSEDFLTPERMESHFHFKDLKDFGFTDVVHNLYEQTFTFTSDEYIAYIDTMADNRGLPEENKTALYAGVKEAIDNFGGIHGENMVFQLYMGRIPPV